MEQPKQFRIKAAEKLFKTVGILAKCNLVTLCDFMIKEMCQWYEIFPSFQMPGKGLRGKRMRYSNVF